MKVHVECYAGYRAHERPLRFQFGNHAVEVKEIIDSWYGTAHRYFKLLGTDGNMYILRCDEQHFVWELIFWEKGNLPLTLHITNKRLF
ncbi:MAG: hypothetical protein N2316_11625 [Spirochaetes bacterium]|nr:hypothetical protein [Spirochaetota bacterium]